MKTGYKHTKEAKEKNRLAHQGKVASLETRKKMSLAGKGKKKPPRSDEWKRKQSEVRKGIPRPNRRGSNHHWWKGGITEINNKIRHSLEYIIWRRALLERDNYTCVWCFRHPLRTKTNTIKLHADHIKPFAYFPELRFAIDNGRTLCEDCHKTTETYGKNL